MLRSSVTASRMCAASPGRDVGALADVRADRQEGGVEGALAHRLEDVRDLGVQLERDAEVEDALHLGVEYLARQTVAGDAEAHHAAGHRAGVADRDRVPAAGEVVGGREPRRTAADDEHPLAGGLGIDFELPALPDRLVAEEALDAVDADALIHLPAVARRLAGVVADTPHHSGQRVVLHELAPGRLVIAGLGVVEPALNVLPGRAAVVARRQAVHVLRALLPPGARLVREARAHVERDRKRLVHHSASAAAPFDDGPWGPAAASSSRPKRRMLRSAPAWMRAITSM